MGEKFYKLTDQNLQTRNGCQWAIGEWKETDGQGGLCGPGWLHCYNDPLVAVFMNPVHANISNPVLWEVEVSGECKDDHGLKCGWTKMRLVKRTRLPVISTEKLVEIVIHCAILSGYDEENFITWAIHWINGDDRSEAAAEAAAWAAAQGAGGDQFILKDLLHELLD